MSLRVHPTDWLFIHTSMFWVVQLMISAGFGPAALWELNGQALGDAMRATQRRWVS